MRFILKVDKDDMFRSADIKNIGAVELLIINAALCDFVGNENRAEADREMARAMLEEMRAKSERPSRPIADGGKQMKKHDIVYILKQGRQQHTQ